ncbi:MAG: 30S ribosomal protein S1 [Bacillota bacterium]|nr:30S ribosomal protein S1 [Bacillota bacterium]
MSEILNADTSEVITTGEQNFEEMLEESLKNFNTDERVRGVVVGIAPNEVYVDVGRKQAGFIPLDELSNNPNDKTEDLVKVGDELELLIMKTNDQEGTIMLSKKRVDAEKGWELIANAKENDELLDGKVIDVIKGGIVVLSNGIRIFIPASQATINRNDPLDGLMNEDVKFRLLELELKGRRRRAIGSMRSVLKEQRNAQKSKFWESVEVGKTYTGTVKSLTSYGAFVDIGGVDGMIHISELSWGRIKHPSEVLNVGDVVDVYVKDIDTEKGNISLGYKKTEDNPWEILKAKYPVGTVLKSKIVGMTTFGAFATVIPGIDGLVHISQIANRRIEKPQDELSVGQEVDAKILDIDFDKKRVSLSIRALLPDAFIIDDTDSSEKTETSNADTSAETEAVASEESTAESAE